MDIAKRGYENGMFPANTAFFPLYPLLTRLLGNLLFAKYMAAGVLISNVSFFVALIYSIA